MSLIFKKVYLETLGELHKFLTLLILTDVSITLIYVNVNTIIHIII